MAKGHLTRTKLRYHGVQASELAYPNTGASPPLIHNVWLNLNHLKLKRRLIGPAKSLMAQLNTVEGAIAPYVASYHDILFCHRSYENAESLRRLTCLHALNHVFKYVNFGSVSSLYSEYLLSITRAHIPLEHEIE